MEVLWRADSLRNVITTYLRLRQPEKWKGHGRFGWVCSVLGARMGLTTGGGFCKVWIHVVLGRGVLTVVTQTQMEAILIDW